MSGFQVWIVPSAPPETNRWTSPSLVGTCWSAVDNAASEATGPRCPANRFGSSCRQAATGRCCRRCPRIRASRLRRSGSRRGRALGLDAGRLRSRAVGLLEVRHTVTRPCESPAASSPRPLLSSPRPRPRPSCRLRGLGRGWGRPIRDRGIRSGSRWSMGQCPIP